MGDRPSIEFQTASDITIPEGETGTVLAAAVVPGLSGNVPRDTIVLMVSPMKGIAGVTNPEAFTGGVETKDDESLRLRIDTVYDGLDQNFVGCDADYVRWAEEVDGVGAAYAMPCWNGPGTVKVVVVDANGQPANDLILASVYQYIFPLTTDCPGRPPSAPR